MKQQWGCLVVAALIAVAAYYFWSTRPARENAAVLDVIEQGEVMIIGKGAGPDAISFAVSRVAPGGDRVEFVIPAGTVLYSAESGVQRMVTARPVSVVLEAGASQANVQVEAFCLDQTLDPPVVESELRFQPATGSDGSVQEPVEPQTATVVACIGALEGRHPNRQFAIWIAMDPSVLDQSPDELRASLRSRYAKKLLPRAEADLRSEFRARFSNAQPQIANEQIDRALERYIAEDLPSRVASRARTMAEREVRHFLLPEVRGMLTTCKLDPAGKRLFA